MAKAGRRPAMSAAEKKSLKAEMSTVLKGLGDMRAQKAALEQAEHDVARAIHDKIGGVSFRFNGETLQAIKRTDKDESGNVVSVKYFVRSFGERKVLDF